MYKTVCIIIGIYYGRCRFYWYIPDGKVHGANMGPIWGRQDPGGSNVGPMNFAIWDYELEGHLSVTWFNWDYGIIITPVALSIM